MSNASNIAIGEPTGSYTTGEYIEFVQIGDGVLEFNYEDVHSTNNFKTTAPGAIVTTYWNGTGWAFLCGLCETFEPVTDNYLSLPPTPPVAYFNANLYSQNDTEAVNTADDLSGNGYDFVTYNAAPTMSVSGGRKAVLHNGTTQALRMASNHAALDWTPNASNYTIIIHFGPEVQNNFSAHTLTKTGYSGSAQEQFQIVSNSSGTNYTAGAGGANQNLLSFRTNLEGDYIVIRRSGGNVFLYRNNTEVINWAPGATKTTNPWALGARSFSIAGYMDMSWEKVVFYDYAVDLSILTDLYNSRNTD